MRGYKVLYFNTRKLLIQSKLAHIDSFIFKLLDKIAKTRLLIVDDFGVTHLNNQQQLDLLEIIEDRHARFSTIIVSQLLVKNW